MQQMVQIRTVKQYFNEYIVENLKGKTKVSEVDLIPIRQQVLDAFRREVFGQIVFKLGPEAATMSKDDLAKIDFIHNILVAAFRKWKRFCILCGEYGLGSFFQLEDLQRILEEDEPDPEEVVTLPDDPGEDVTDQLTEPPVILATPDSSNQMQSPTDNVSEANLASDLTEGS